MELDLISEDPQFLFDTAIRKLAEQGRPSISATLYSCVYEDKGTRCAVGWLLTDKAIEVYGESDLPIEEICSFGRGHVSLEFLADLQNMHDFAENRRDFKEAAFSLAKKHKLDSSVIHRKLTEDWCAGLWYKPPYC